VRQRACHRVLRPARLPLSGAPLLYYVHENDGAISITIERSRRRAAAQIQGFFLNSTHYDWTSHEIRYGEQISRLTGGKHLVVNTGTNGQGPLIPADRAVDGNEVLCNPPGRGLGPLPSTNTGYRNVDAFAWTSNPGQSTGVCGAGAPPTGEFWPAYGVTLVETADFRVR
jgi:endoglucanase